MPRTTKKKAAKKGKKGFSILGEDGSSRGSEDENLPKDEAGRLKIKRQYEDLLGIRIAKLAGRILNRERIDKGPRFTNWAERPLTDEQINYALSDVTHLCVVYERLSSMLKTRGRADWAAEEQQALVDPATYDMAPETAWKRLKTRRRATSFSF